MTYAILLLWTATAQTENLPSAARATAPTVIVQCPPGGDEHTLRAQLDEARSQLARAKDAWSLPDHAVAALLVSDHQELTSFVRYTSRSANRGGRRAKIEVFLPQDESRTMVAVVVSLKNPGNESAWEPTEAVVKTPFAPRTMAAFNLPVLWFPPAPAAVRSMPQRIAPGQWAKIAVVFDKADIEFTGGALIVELLRGEKGEFEFELSPAEIKLSKDQGEL